MRSKVDRPSKGRLAFLASSVLALLVLSSVAGAENASFKANFNLHAASAIVSTGKLTLSDISPVVFVVESGQNTAHGVSESTTFFLERWKLLEHSIRPHGILFTSSKLQDTAYRSLRFDIDNPSPLGDDSSVWTFEITHLDETQDAFKEAPSIGPVMLTVVMEHTQKEVAEGRVCGPWKVKDLRGHHDLLGE